MSSNLRQHLPKLQVVASIKSIKVRKLVLEEFSKDKEFCSAIREIFKNLKKRNIKLNDHQRRKLRRHKTVIFGVLEKRKGAKRRKKLIVQTGNGFLLPILIPLVAEVVGQLIQSRYESR